MTWERGRERVDELLARGELEEVTASEALADRLVREADKHLTAAGQIVAIDEAGAYQLAYDAAQKPAQRCSPSKACVRRPGVAMWLSRTRSRPSSVGGAAWPPSGLSLGCGANGPPASTRTCVTPTTTTEEAREAIESANGILAAAKGLLASGNVHPFR